MSDDKYKYTVMVAVAITVKQGTKLWEVAKLATDPYAGRTGYSVLSVGSVDHTDARYVNSEAATAKTS